MFTLKWNGDYATYKTVFADDWKRLDRCNAAVYESELYRGVGYDEREYFLVSYASPIMSVLVRSYSDGHVRFVIRVNEVQWNCSTSTIRHIGRFLKRFGFPFTYHDVKAIMNGQRMKLYFGANIEFTDARGFDIALHYMRETPHTLKDYFNCRTPFYA